MTRLIAPRMAERLGQNVVVDNRAGAAGQLGLQLGAKAQPDGYTLMGGHVDAAIDGITGMTPHIKSGKLIRAIGLTPK